MSRNRPPPDLPGYRFIGLIGEGGSGLVWKAEQEHPRRMVAIKFLRDAPSFGEETMQILDILSDHDSAEFVRFQREVELMAQIEHPNVARLYASGIAEDLTPYFVMEFVDGQPLQNWVKNQAGFGIPERVELLRQICSGVGRAHKLGVVHRDLKPGNVMVTSEGVAKVVDFGLGKKLTTSDESKRGDITLDDVVAGTPAYMSPEQVTGDFGKADQRSDVYSLGVLAYELFANRLPYKVGKGIHSISNAVLHTIPPKPSTLAPAMSAELDVIIGKALEKESGRRYPNAFEMGEDLKRYQEGLPLAARAPSTVYLVTRKIARNRNVFGTVCVSLLLLLLVGLVAFLLVSNARDRSAAAEMARLAAVGETESQTSARKKAEADAETARRERLRVEAEVRANAPKLLLSARQFAEQGELLQATTLAEQALVDDPNVLAAHELLALLKAESRKPEEALQHLQVLDEAGILPESFIPMRALLAAERDDPKLRDPASLAMHATTSGYLAIGAALLRQTSAMNDLHKLFTADTALNGLDSEAMVGAEDFIRQQCMPIWLKKLASGGESTYPRCLRFTRENGLTFLSVRGSGFQIHSLSPLWGIPLHDLRLSMMPHVSNLEPLDGMPLHSLICEGNQITNLSPIAAAPLRRFHFRNAGPITSIAALEGKVLEECLIYLDRETSENLSDWDTLGTLHCERLELAAFLPNLDFLSRIKGLKELKIRGVQGTHSRDWSPLLALTDLERLEGGEAWLGHLLMPTLRLIHAGKLDEAQRELDRLEEAISGPAFQPLSTSIDVLRYLIHRKQGLDHDPPALPCIQRSQFGTIAVLPIRFEPDATEIPNRFEHVCEIAAQLDVRMVNFPRTVTFRKAKGWICHPTEGGHDRVLIGNLLDSTDRLLPVQPNCQQVPAGTRLVGLSSQRFRSFSLSDFHAIAFEWK